MVYTEWKYIVIIHKFLHGPHQYVEVKYGQWSMKKRKKIIVNVSIFGDTH